MTSSSGSGHEAKFHDYPLNATRSDLDVEDLHLYNKKLEHKIPTLFVQASANCRSSCGCREGRMDVKSEGQACVQSPPLVLNSVKDLETSWKDSLERGNTSLIIIHRKNSWSRMKILPDMFKYICHWISVHPRFLDFVFEFGGKTTSIDETFVSFYKFVSFPASGGANPSSVDVCYNLRFFEPHGRQLADPWSCRQSAIHQKFYPSRGNSAWIIIHQPMTLRESLQHAQSQSFLHPMAMHIRYIRSANYHWRDYLNYRNSELLSLDGRLSIAKPFRDFQIDFATIQKIHSIRRKLQISISILDGVLDILANLAALVDLIGGMMDATQGVCAVMRIEMEQMSIEMKSHKLTAQSLLNISDDLRFMGRNVLALYNQEMTINNGTSIRQLAQAGAVDNQNLAHITEETRKDSRTMRIATLIAMVYLPANLVTSFFGTSLVSFQSNEQDSATTSGVHMMVHRQVWIVIFTSIFLAAGTMGAVGLVDRFGQRQRASKFFDGLLSSFS